MVNCAAAADHLRNGREQREFEREQIAVDAASEADVVDGAVDVFRRQPRRKRRELMRLAESNGPESRTFGDGGGI